MLERIALTLEERAFCKAVGDARTEANKDKNDIPDYDESRFNLSSLQANRLGAFSEGLAFKGIGGNILDHTLDEWAHFVPNNHPEYRRLVKEQADLNLNGLAVEVRRANSRHSPIPIRAKDKESAAIVLQVFIPYKQAQPTKDNPFPNIIVPLHGLLTGWAKVTDKGTKPAWAKQAGSLVVERRPLDTLNLKEWMGR